MPRLGVGVEPLAADTGEPTRLQPTAFEELYHDEFAAMVRVAYLITRDQPVAEEIVNDAFIALLQRWTSVATPGGYLRTTVVRAAVRNRRRRSREREVAARLRPVAPPAEPEIDEMWDALGELPVQQRAAIVLRFYADASHEQIASALHCPVATARSLVHRGLVTLRKDLDRWT